MSEFNPYKGLEIQIPIRIRIGVLLVTVGLTLKVLSVNKSEGVNCQYRYRR